MQSHNPKQRFKEYNYLVIKMEDYIIENKVKVIRTKTPKISQ